jgi:alpha-L-rhamnosidase
MYGEIGSGWTLDGEKLTMQVKVPANTSATIHIPGDPTAVEINGSDVAASDMTYEVRDGVMLLTAGSGDYTIVSFMK